MVASALAKCLVRGGREDPTRGSSRVVGGWCVWWGGVGGGLSGTARADVVGVLGTAGGVVVAVLGAPTRSSTTHEPKGYA